MHGIIGADAFPMDHHSTTLFNDHHHHNHNEDGTSHTEISMNSDHHGSGFHKHHATNQNEVDGHHHHGEKHSASQFPEKGEDADADDADTGDSGDMGGPDAATKSSQKVVAKPKSRFSWSRKTKTPKPDPEETDLSETTSFPFMGSSQQGYGQSGGYGNSSSSGGMFGRKPPTGPVIFLVPTRGVGTCSGGSPNMVQLPSMMSMDKLMLMAVSGIGSKRTALVDFF
jgi:hypothetical protein